MKKLKIVYVVCGFREYAQAESFALYTRQKRDTNIFITNDKKLAKNILNTGFKVLLSTITNLTKKLVQEIDLQGKCKSQKFFLEKTITLEVYHKN
ncbi:hypothetical protein GOV09_00735 [Candidatus Woesearchaeota archaeon]|nr:hypothetical protein [Candidatus Woesearchaeota archaeon]